MSDELKVPLKTFLALTCLVACRYNVPVRQPVAVVGHAATHRPTHAKRAPPTIHCTAEELASLAQFPDKQRATRTLQLLGLLHK